MEKILYNGVVIGHLEGSVITIKKDITKHLYRYLHSFCITDMLYKDSRIYTFEFITENNVYIITRDELELFMQHYNAYFTFNNSEKQIAIPLVLMNIWDNNKILKTNSFDIKGFKQITFDNERYVNWQSRNKNKMER